MKTRFILALGTMLSVSGFALAADNEADLTIGPDYAPAPEMAVDPAVAHGTVQDFVMNSADSRLYPGIARVDNAITQRRDAYGNRMAAADSDQSVAASYQRHVWVYIPAGYVPGTVTPFMVLQDGHSYRDKLVRALDSLIAARKLPSMVAVMIDSGGGDAQGSERGLEYDTMSGRYAEFIETEVLPSVARQYRIAFTKDPDGRATMGGSSGAAAAFSMAWYHPELYHRVLSYSGTFVNQQSPPDSKTPRGAWEYHGHMVAQSPKKPIRIWMEVGEKDLHFDDPESSFHNWPLANQRMAAALKAKGYAAYFIFAKDAKHVDPRVMEQTLPAALEWVWAGYPVR